MNEPSDKIKGKESKGFWAKLIAKLDKKLEEKAEKSCCASQDKNKGPSCCS